MGDYYKTLENMRKELEEEFKDWKTEIRESKYGLLKIIGIESIPFVMGATLAGIGRLTDMEYLPLVPIGMDFMVNASGYCSKGGIIGLAKYGAGIAAIYSDLIISS